MGIAFVFCRTEVRSETVFMRSFARGSIVLIVLTTSAAATATINYLCLVQKVCSHLTVRYRHSFLFKGLRDLNLEKDTRLPFRDPHYLALLEFWFAALSRLRVIGVTASFLQELHYHISLFLCRTGKLM
jgi:hypothetical protein